MKMDKVNLTYTVKKIIRMAKKEARNRDFYDFEDVETKNFAKRLIYIDIQREHITDMIIFHRRGKNDQFNEIELRELLKNYMSIIFNQFFI